MIDRGKVDILGVGVNIIDYEGAVAQIVSAAESKRPFAVSALAVHGVMTGALDERHRYRLNRLDLVTPDGQPVRWAMRILHGEKLKDRVYGPTMTVRLCEAAANRGLSIYLYGSRQKVLDAWSANLRAKLPDLKIAGSEPSKFRRLTPEENDQMISRIKASGADIVFVGLGCPRQEVFAFENRDALSMPLIAVGAAFDFHAGSLSQAPPWMQDNGLEWVYRLYREPRRLWRRYLLLNPLYIWMVAMQKMVSRRPPALTETIELEHYG
jgi:N-acetylglucosaminyldiphosphoundecaprenol N-acetyl-beta-D-mannosaminyltransferase